MLLKLVYLQFFVLNNLMTNFCKNFNSHKFIRPIVKWAIKNIEDEVKPFSYVGKTGKWKIQYDSSKWDSDNQSSYTVFLADEKLVIIATLLFNNIEFKCIK